MKLKVFDAVDVSTKNVEKLKNTHNYSHMETEKIDIIQKINKIKQRISKLKIVDSIQKMGITIYSMIHIYRLRPFIIEEPKIQSVLNDDDNIVCAIRTSIKSLNYKEPVCLKASSNEDEINEFMEFVKTCRKRRGSYQTMSVFRCRNNKDYIFIATIIS